MAPLPAKLAATLALLTAPAAIAPLPPSTVAALVAKVADDEARALAVQRGLRPGPPLAVSIFDRPQLAAERSALSRRSPRGLPPDLVAAEAALLFRLGIGGPAASSAPAPDIETDDPTGLYAPTTKRVAIANWVPLDQGRFARWHDLALALLDRRFTFGRFLEAVAPSIGDEASAHTDALLARLALAEGDATVQALEHLSPQGPPPSQVLGALLETTREELAGEPGGAPTLERARRAFLQLDGTAFVARLRARAPWAAVNDAWARPPESTEQILHPEKYVARDGPADLSAHVPAKLMDGWQAVFRDTLGELGVRAFLRAAVGDYRAERAAAGWKGDRVGLYRGPRAHGHGADDASDEHELVVWVTAWDDPSDADDFAEQAEAALSALAGAPLKPAAPTAVRGSAADKRARRARHADSAGRVFALEQRGSTVGLLLHATANAEHAFTALVQAAATRGAARPRGRGRP